jgi:hypothetical protein
MRPWRLLAISKRQWLLESSALAKVLLDEAAILFLSGEPETAPLILRDLVNATLGFELLGVFIGCCRPKVIRTWITWRQFLAR